MDEEVLKTILERNARVEREKAWETSFTRRAIIAALIYVFASVFLLSLGSSFVVIQALIPTSGYLLSTLSLPWIKRRWMERKVVTGA